MAIIYGYNKSMIEVGMAEGKNQFLKLIRRVEAGERIVITRHGVPVAQLTPPPARTGKARLGEMRDRIRLLPGWDAPIDPGSFLEGKL
jgi:prevent-host-death family protein